MDFIAEPLIYIFNLNFSNSEIPNMWKFALLLAFVKGNPLIITAITTGHSLNHVLLANPWTDSNEFKYIIEINGTLNTKTSVWL